MQKVFIGFVIVLLAAMGFWYVTAGNRQTVPLTTSPDAMQENGGAMEDGSVPMVSKTGSSDAQLDADLNTIDAQIKAAGDAGTDALSFNDTPVQQTE